MLSDLLAFLGRVFSHWLAWVGLLSTALRIWAELSERPERTFLGNRTLWTTLSVIFLFAACFQAWRDEHAKAAAAGPSFALVSSDGKLVSQRNFEQYRLSVERQDEPDASGNPWPKYYLRFDREPEMFDVRTDEGATVQKERIGPGKSGCSSSAPASEVRSSRPPSRSRRADVAMIRTPGARRERQASSVAMVETEMLRGSERRR